ncbi:CU044_5270 family protein [Rhizohabitans arisaemae]|uniref:CU044_5270 family protein n=1 Tax=Rhizohabitans arisaemae TaxID=2720610 RepID=UPI0024B1DEAA|nr:CU044_5270 family protein [Rhizohabitans arisaemae]
MDELDAIKDLYGEPPADPGARARVRERLRAQPRQRLRRPWRLRWTLAVATLAAGAALVAVAIPGELTGPAVDGRSILLAAASTAEAQTTPAGTYWRVRKLSRDTLPEPVGRGPNRYRLTEATVTELWAAEDGRVWSGSLELGVRPRPGADEEAWRRDGSPTVWRSRGRALAVSPGKGRIARVGDGVAFSMAGREMTFDAIRRLPTEPGALHAWVTEAVRDTPLGASDGVVADALCGLLWSKPSPPKVRAAAYRALAELPGVRYLGESADELGRTGAAFSFTVRAERRTLIIDTASSRVLSAASGGDRVELVVEAGWTNDVPAAPSAR